jgi:valyl-tRNA synthetase
MRFSDEKIEAARNFANKLWNASRFVRMNLTIEEVKLPASDALAKEDKWILDAFAKLVENVPASLDKFEVGVALSAIYEFTWDVFCDWYIELSKARLSAKDTPENLTAQNVIAYVLTGILKLLHPFMPFITEEIYQALPHTAESIVISEFPKIENTVVYKSEVEDVDRIIGCIVAIRARRSEMNVPPSKKAKLFVVTKYADTFEKTAKILEKLASASEVVITDSYDSDDAVAIATDAGTVYIPLAEVIDFEKERARLTAETKKNDAEIERIEKKLSNEGFVSKAPAAVIEGERAKLQKYLETREALAAALSKLG